MYWITLFACKASQEFGLRGYHELNALVADIMAAVRNNSRKIGLAEVLMASNTFLFGLHYNLDTLLLYIYNLNRILIIY